MGRLRFVAAMGIAFSHRRKADATVGREIRQVEHVFPVVKRQYRRFAILVDGSMVVGSRMLRSRKCAETTQSQSFTKVTLGLSDLHS
jgi:hypothetical protein